VASLISDFEKVQQVISNGINNMKIAQLGAMTKDVHNKDWRITSDFGASQINTDNTLQITNDDRNGLRLLGDGFAREKFHRFDHGRIVVHALDSFETGKLPWATRDNLVSMKAYGASKRDDDLKLLRDVADIKHINKHAPRPLGVSIVSVSSRKPRICENLSATLGCA
jgi:hypothetical protein